MSFGSTLRRFVSTFAFACVALAASTFAHADQIYSTLNGQQLQNIMLKEGYTATVDKDGDINWKLDGYNVLILIADDKKSVKFLASFSDKTTMERINAWNRGKRYSRTFLAENGNPRLALDLDVTGGVTTARIVDYLLTCRVSFKQWVDEVLP